MRSRTGKKASYYPAVYWDDAETSLLKDIDSDVLVILDCCYSANSAMERPMSTPTEGNPSINFNHRFRSSGPSKSSGEDHPVYESIEVFSADNVTDGAGESSFTSALISSLKELSQESRDSTFTSKALMEKISLKKDMLGSVVADNSQGQKRYRRLGPLKPTQNAPRAKEPERASLLLRFSLTTDNLEQAQIEKLAQQLPEAFREAHVPVRRIDWVKLDAAKRDHSSFHEVANAEMAIQRPRRRCQ